MTLVFIDAKNALFRYGHVFQGLRSDEGESTGILYGLIGCLLTLKRKYPDAFFVFAWDGGGKGWRHDLFPEYKANRKKLTEKPELVVNILAQMPQVKRLGKLLGIPNVEVAGVEADDIIGIMSRAVPLRGSTSSPVIYSSDKDFVQLMRYGVRVIRNVDKVKKMKVETLESVHEMFGCTPRDVLKVRALAGDHSDGIPSAAPGIGGKTATKLVMEMAVNPSKRKINVPVAATLKASHPLVKVQASWQRAHTNYKIMRILTSASDEVLSDVTSVSILEWISFVEARMRRPITQSRHKKYRELVAFLSTKGLVEALEQRQNLFAIQSRLHS